MPLVELTKENFDDVIEKNEIILVDFWAEWCGPCKVFAKVYEEVAARHPTIVFGKIDTEAQPELAAEFQIRSIPTLLVIRKKVVLYADSGTMPASALEELITQAKEVDLDVLTKNG